MITFRPDHKVKIATWALTTVIIALFALSGCNNDTGSDALFTKLKDGGLTEKTGAGDNEKTTEPATTESGTDSAVTNSAAGDQAPGSDPEAEYAAGESDSITGSESGSSGSVDNLILDLLLFPPHEWPTFSRYEGPEIHIIDASSSGSSLVISGYVEDQDGVKSLTLNGGAVALAKDAYNQYNFSINVPGTATMFNFMAKDGDGNWNDLSIGRPGTDAAFPLNLRINEKALPALSDVMADLLMSMDMVPTLNEFLPIKACAASLFGVCLYSVTVDEITRASLEKPALMLQMTGGNRLKLHADAPYFYAKTYFSIPLIHGIMAQFSGNLTIDAEMTVSVVNNAIQVNLASINTDIDDYDLYTFGIDVAHLPFIRDYIRDLLQKNINKTMMAKIPAFSAKAIESMALNAIATFDEKGININADPKDCTITYDALTLVLNVISTPKTEIVNTNALGMVCSVDDLPESPSVTPSGSTFDIHALLPSNLLNQAMLAAYQSGMLNITDTIPHDVVAGTMEKLLRLVDLGSILPSELIESLAPDITYRVIPISAPEIRLLERKSADNRSLANVSLNDVEVQISLSNDNFPGMNFTMGAVLDADVDASLDIRQVNPVTAASLPHRIDLEMDVDSLFLSQFINLESLIDAETKNFISVTPVIGSLPSIQIKYITFNGIDIRIPIVPFDEEYLNLPGEVSDMMVVVMNGAMPLLLEVIGAIPVPSVLGNSMMVREMWVPADGSNYVGVGADLIKLQ